MKAAIAIDDWKLPIFERHLKEAGYEFKTVPGLTPGTLLLQVITTRSFTELQPIVQAAQLEAARSKKP